MDEMQLIREFGESVPLANHDELAVARAKLLVAASGQQDADHEPATAHRLRSRKRLRWLGATAVGLAAAITAVVATAPVDKIGLPVPEASADPVRVLQNAAAAALKLPDTPPGPDQFVYTKTQDPQGIREAWLSADGTRDGLIRMGEVIPIPGCKDGKRAASKGDKVIKRETEVCTPDPAYLADLPTDADAMYAYLNKNHSGKAGDVNAIGKDVLTLAAEHYLRPQSRAALFEAAGKVPGVKVVEHAVDGARRPGIGITWPNPPGSLASAKPIVLVFDATSFAYLGWQDGAVLTSAIVDQVNQRP
jgi:hypothetical protein